MTQLLIIGGSDAGISAALKAKELAPQTQVTVMLSDAFPNYSICGLPFFLSGEVSDWKNLAHRTQNDITQLGIKLLVNHTATNIDSSEKIVTAVDIQGQEQQIDFQKLVIATGATSRKPKILGLDCPGVYFLRWMGDSFAVHQHLIQYQPKSALIVGGGYIGMEMADALTLRGLKVTVVEHSPTVLKTVTASLGQMVSEELQRHGVTVVNGVSIQTISLKDKQLVVTGSNEFETTADLVLVAVGATPTTELAQSAGIELGVAGAIKVNRQMETNIPDIYAAGDCVETWHRLLDKPVYLPLGTTAHKQGRIAGENALGGHREFAGSLGTQVVKIFDLAIARTGLREDVERLDLSYTPPLSSPFDPVQMSTQAWCRKYQLAPA